MAQIKKSHHKQDSSFYDHFFKGYRISQEELDKRGVTSGVKLGNLGIGEVGKIPDVSDPSRRESGRFNFKLYLNTYFPLEFYLGFSEDHLTVIKKIEKSVLKGELYAIAMPRGSGKSTLCEKAVTWCICYAHRHFVALIGSDKGAATGLLDSIKGDLSNNETLLDDFPEICYPISALNGMAQRANSQTHEGQPTNVEWKTDAIVMPTIKGSDSSGIVVRAYGLTGGIRGQSYKKKTGEKVRPDFIICDDPQTDQSAYSPSQNDTRERLLQGAVLKLAGPDVSMAGIMPCTVIAKDDMADRILNRNKNPRWQGDRMKMIYEYPKYLEPGNEFDENEVTWQDYKRVWDEGWRNEDGGKAGNDFYINHRKHLDKGCVVAWEDRIEEGDVSAIQSAMNFYLENYSAFMAEYQNEPVSDFDDVDNQLNVEDLELRCNKIPKQVVPDEYGQLVAFADVGSLTGITWMVIALGEKFSGSIIEYGNVNVKTGKGYDEKVEVYKGLTKAVDLMNKPYYNESGVEFKLNTIGIDSGWNTDLVYKFCREYRDSNILIPTKGAYVKPAQKLYGTKAKGARLGTEWIYAAVQNSTKKTRLFRYNTNHWKTFVLDRFRMGLGGDGSMMFFGTKSLHKNLFQHFNSEYRIRVQVENKLYDNWSLKPNRDNHYFDCIVGCCVLGNYIGVDTMGKADVSVDRKRKRRKFTSSGVA